MQKSETLARFAPQRRVAPSRRFEHFEGPHDVCLHERRRIVDRTIDMGFGGEVDDPVRLVRGEGGFDGLAVGDVSLDEGESRIVQDILEAGQIARIGQFVQNGDSPVCFPQSQTNEIGADESRAPRDEHGRHDEFLSRKTSAWRPAECEKSRE
ncbi:MAG: hypothetical protein BWZ10_03514 [candidate division BRC1 bacterium ADurb.BinA364]|nr:MAG: hypothetical protein BWZ10_03514 [candidate division BRC1 bacterium ADurb.BinA364]